MLMRTCPLPPLLTLTRSLPLVAVVTVALAVRLVAGDAADPEAVRAGIAASGWWGPLLLAGAFAAATLVLLPTSPLALLAGFLFGAAAGAAVVVVAALVAALAAYAIARAASGSLHAWLERRATRALAAVNARGLRAVILSRLLFLPFGPVSYAWGLARIPARTFALGTLLGALPLILLFCFLGAAVGEPSALVAPAFLGPFGGAVAVSLVAAWRTPAPLALPRAPLVTRLRAIPDRLESSLARAGAALARPAIFHAVVAALVALAVLVRLPLVFRAQDVTMAHGDSWIFFNQAWVDLLGGRGYPDPHRGSGWQLLLAGTLWLLGVAPGAQWIAYDAPVPPEAMEAALVAHALSAVISAGAVAATYLLAREILPRGLTLVAMTLVAFDPFLLRIATSGMSEPPYIAIFVLALVTVLRARRHPSWLLATGALMALAHVLRINGLVMFVMALAFAALYLRRTTTRVPWRWLAASVLVFSLVATPYLAWRAQSLPGPFDYGTNQRFWADELWDLDDAYWQGFSPATGGERETMADYFATHHWTEAVARLWRSVQWQAFDVTGVGQWPPLEEEGGGWQGGNATGAALTPLGFGLALAGAFVAGWRRRPELWMLPLALAFTCATFVWIYPLVRSVRYFAPLIPLFVVLALVGWQHLSAHLRWPRLATVALFGAYVALYGAWLLLNVPAAIADTLGSPHVLTLALVAGGFWVALALLPAVPDAVRFLRRGGSRVGEPETE